MVPVPLVGLLVSLGLALAPPATPAEGALYSDGPDGMYLLASGWKGRADPHNRGERLGWWQVGHDKGFVPVSVPSSFNATRRDAGGFRAGVYWYRERFHLPADPLASSWRLRFEGIGRRALVFLNGRFVGAAAGPWLPSEVKASSIRDGDNELVVRVDGRPRPGDLPPSNRPAGWWNYAGLVREVYLRRVAPLDLGDLQVTTRLEGGRARVHVAGQVRNTGRSPRAAPFESLRLLGPRDPRPKDVRPALSPAVRLLPGRLTRVRASFTIDKPRLWSPEQPSLYELQLQIPGGQRTTVHFGIREWRRTRDGRVLLNGRPIALRGASFHEQVPGRGAALTPLDRAKLVTELGRLGADFARAHYPPHPALLDAFDRLGIVYWDEVPVWRLRGTQLAGPLAKRGLALLRKMILRDRNHASVMVWSVENETLRGGQPEAAYLQRARALIRRLDPTRLLGVAAALNPVDQLNPALRQVDALGLNDYLGWYSGHVSDTAGDLRAVRLRFPTQALFVSEFGAEADRDGPRSEKGTYAFQASFMRRQTSTLKRAPHLNGVLAWILRDFVARPGWSGGNPQPRPPVNFKGLLHEDGTPKPAFAVVREGFGPRVSRPGGAP